MIFTSTQLQIDIVQYEAETQLPEDICMTSNKSISEKVSDLINEVFD